MRVTLYVYTIIIIGTVLLPLTHAAETQGVSVLSIDSPNVQSSSKSLENLNWLVTTTSTGGDRIQFTLNTEDFEQQTGTPSKKPFTATVNNVEETLTYNVNVQRDFTIYDYHVSDVVTWDTSCPPGEKIQVLKVDRVWPFSDLKVCVTRTLNGKYGTVDKPTTTFEAELSVTNGEDSLPVKTISSEDTNVVFEKGGEKLATASWQGSLVTGNTPPSVPEIGVLQSNSGDEWNFISRTDFSEYQNAQNDFNRRIDEEVDLAQRRLDEGIYTSKEILNMFQSNLDSANDNLEEVRADTVSQQTTLSSELSLLNPTSETSAKLEFNPDVRLNQEVITWWIRADWIGVQRLVGEPVITNVEADEVGQSQPGTVSIQVENQGNAGAEFGAALKQCDEFTTTQVPSNRFVQSGETVTMQFFVDTGTQNKDITEQCTVEVFDTNDRTRSDSESVTLEFRAEQTCTPGKHWVDGNTIKKCSADGTQAITVANCEDGKVAKFTDTGQYNGFECVDETGPTPSQPACNDGEDNDEDGKVDMNDPGCEFPSDDSEQNGATSSSGILLFSALIALALGAVTFFNVNTGNMWINGGIALLVGALTGLGVFIATSWIVNVVQNVIASLQQIPGV